ncbi:branched-chain amino acid ABC transporter permease [Actinorhabdospora filicis]|uniref:branched-chain amino acid ABC transporter permease n=1 Tax=Actinorhabdospora filicis TaxID=1785913 RepID=UPI002556E1C9|nr:branched-chain amino acid ABC transporter permease [Actinorhabdospora filicis]
MRGRWQSIPKPVRLLAGLAGVVLLFALPNIAIPGIPFRTDEIPNGIGFSFVLSTIAIYVLVAVGLNVVVGMAGLLDLGYIGFYAVGAYTVAIFGSPDSIVATKYPWLICVPIAIALTMVSGVILGTPTLRLRGDYLAIVTLGFGEIIRLVAVNLRVTNGQRGIPSVPAPDEAHVDWNVFGWFRIKFDFDLDIFTPMDARPYYWLALVLIIVVILAVRSMERSRVGRSWLAIREDEDAASIMGVESFKFKLWAFAIGAAIGGLSGALFATRNVFVNSGNFNLLLSVMFVAAIVLGGQGNILGVVLGTVIVFYLPERFRFLSTKRELVFGLALIVIMVLRPQGLWPSRRRARELQDRKLEAKEAAAGA